MASLRKKSNFILTTCILLLSVGFLEGQPATVITFEEGLKKLLSANAAIDREKASLISFEANVDRVKNLWVPSVGITTFVAPAYATEGNALSSSNDYSRWGPAYYGQITVVMPVFSFGASTEARYAAEHGLEAGKSLTEGTINENIYQYKKLYLSVILLKKLEILLADARKKMEEAVTSANERYQAGDTNIKRKDLAKIMMYSHELDTMAYQVSIQKANALWAIGHYLGERRSYDVADAEFPDVEMELENLESWLSRFGANPQYRAAISGVAAYKHSLELEKKKSLPVLFIAGMGSYSHTKVREDQQSIYARDPYNEFTGAVVAGARWEFDWGKQHAEQKKAHSNYLKAMSQKREADTGIPLKILMAYNNVDYSYHKWKNEQNKFKEAGKWFVAEWSAFSTGTGSGEDTMEAMAAYYLSEKNIYESEYQYLLAIAELMQVIGDRVSLSKWKEME